MVIIRVITIAVMIVITRLMITMVMMLTNYDEKDDFNYNDLHRRHVS